MSGENWHSLTVEQAVSKLGTGPEGLTSDQAVQSRQQHGSNAIPPAHGRGVIQVLFDQFRSALIYILLVAAVISFAFGEWQDGWIISAVVVLNAVIGFFQEYQATAALQKILRSAAQIVHVVRDRREQEVSIDQLVVGDVVLLASGDRLPADGRWIEALNVKVNEATMTGEAVPVEKISDPLPADTPLQGQRNRGWRGTTVVSGRGKLLVTSVGGATRFGGLLAKLQEIDHSQTPWQERLQQFAKRIAWLTLIIGVVIFILGLVRQMDIEQVFLLSVSMIVAIIPEGLPVVLTIAMASGITIMAKRNAIVRKPVAVETLGAVTIVATDKTGTLTYGEMMVEKAWVNGKIFDFSGAGYNPKGDIFLGQQKVISQEHPDLHLLLRLGALNNDARFAWQPDGQRLPVGDPTELALLVAAEKGGWSKLDLDSAHPRIGEFPFDYKKKYMVTWHRGEKKTLLVVKGAPNEILKMCRQRLRDGQPQALSEADLHEISGVYDQWASQALRGLAIAYADWDDPLTISHERLTDRMVLVGLVGIVDAIRPEAGESLQLMQQAGIRTIMLTGDHQKTGQAVGERLGLMKPGDGADVLLDGGQVDGMSDEELTKRLATVRVGTRLTPDHKYRIAKLLKQQGQVVAMTGDGVNDVPALLEADVGVAIGMSSSDAAKEAADVVLVDGNFRHITVAIAEGRRILRNILRVMIYLIAANFGELVLIMAALIFGLPTPLLPKHIIWLNVMTDPFLGMALAREPQSPTVMQQRPHDRKQPLISRQNWTRIVIGAGTIGLSGLGALLYGCTVCTDPKRIFAITLTTLALAQWMMGVSARSARKSMFSNFFGNKTMLAALGLVLGMQSSILYIPWLADLFSVAPLTLRDWGVVVLGAMPIVIVEEIRKYILRRRPLTVTA